MPLTMKAPFELLLGIAVGLLQAQAKPAGLDNFDLLPRYVPDAEVQMQGASPAWVKSLIMVQFRIETATLEGTFAAAERVLDHYARLGVNGLWINPIFERGSTSNGYLNFGPHGIEPRLTGTPPGEAAFAEVRRFVEAAHRRHLRVFFDIVVWGTAKPAPLVQEHPEFYARDGEKFREVWGGYAFDWSNEAFRTWFEEAAVALVMKTGADGLRVDLAPDTSGYFFERVRRRLYAAGRKILLISEMPNERRDVFDFEQTGVTGWTEPPDYAHAARLAEQKRRFGLPHEYFLTHNLVEAIRTGCGIGSAVLQQRGQGGRFRFYTANLLCHDDVAPAAQGDRVRFAYGTLFTPMIPLWWIGEEWNNPRRPLPDLHGTGVMYFNTIDWEAAQQPTNAAFLEDIKRYLRIRRTYADIFEHYPEHTTEAAIAAVTSRLKGQANPLTAYARYHEAKAILIVPNPSETAAPVEVDLEPEAWGLGSVPLTHLRVTDLLRARPVRARPPSHPRGFVDELAGRHLGLYLVEPISD